MSSKKRKALSIYTKWDIPAEVETAKKSKSQITSDYGIPASSLSTIIKNREKIVSEYNLCGNTQRKRLHTSNYDDIEDALMKRFFGR